MKKIVEITDKKIIEEILVNSEYGTLALSKDNRPYSLPINFVLCENCIYFHGAKKGKKIDFMKENPLASFSVVDSYSLIPSYFCTDSGDASPATHLFKSVIMDGLVEFITNYDEKVKALKVLMEKYQPEGKYNSLDDKSFYEKIINATEVYKLVPHDISGKIKLGQNWSEERYQRVVEHLKQRDTSMDRLTLKLMEMLK